MASAFGVAVPHIETNIRTVYLHLFFADATDVADAAVLPLVASTLDRAHPREWYWALMDYGAALKRRTPNPSRRSRHHARQAPFEGSNRQLRGLLLRAILDGASPDAETLALTTGLDSRTVAAVLAQLVRDGLIAGADGAGRPM
jgi:A/G-specific adenine glycosylase